MAQSARRHRVGKARAVWVIEHPAVKYEQQRPDRDPLTFALGPDHTGRLPESGTYSSSPITR